MVSLLYWILQNSETDIQKDTTRPAIASLLTIETKSRSTWGDRALSEAIEALTIGLEASLNRPVNPDSA